MPASLVPRATSSSLRQLLAWLFVPLMVLTSVARAEAQAAPDRWREDPYYLGHWSMNISLLALALAIDDAEKSERDWSGFPGDASVRRHWSPAADRYSDRTAGLTIAVPVLAEFARGPGPRFINFSTVYGQTLAVNLVLNSAVKRLVSRRRPCTYYATRLGKCSEEDDRYASFYSGHSSASFGAAMAGALMFSEGLDNGWVRASLWAYEFGLASATANMRVHAGMHYYSDVLVGAIVGAGIGIAIPALHDVEPFAFSDQAKGRDWAFDAAGMAAGLGLGILTTELLAFEADSGSGQLGVLRALSSVQVNVAGAEHAVVSFRGAF